MAAANIIYVTSRLFSGYFTQIFRLSHSALNSAPDKAVERGFYAHLGVSMHKISKKVNFYWEKQCFYTSNGCKFLALCLS